MGTKVYFFKDKQYARYDRSDDRLDERYPFPVAGNWSGMSEAGMADVFDAVVNWGNGKLFFFRGDRYVKYDIAGDSVDDGYPLPQVPMDKVREQIPVSCQPIYRIDLQNLSHASKLDHDAIV